METFFKVVGWTTAAILGAAVWNVFPEYRTIISSILVALFICYVFSVLVGERLGGSSGMSCWSFVFKPMQLPTASSS